MDDNNLEISAGKIPVDNLLLGKPVAQKIDAQTRDLIHEFRQHYKTPPTIGTLRIDGDEASASYEKSIFKRALECDIEINSCVFEKDTTQEELLDAIEALNNNDQVHGIMLFRPLPKYIDEQKICSAISPKKDIDSATPSSLAFTFSGKGIGFAPCTAQACIEMLDYYGIDLDGKHCVVLGRSLVVGKPVAMLALQKNASVTILHSHSKNAAKICQDADIIIAAIGRAQSIDNNYMSKNKQQIILDVGINVDPDGKLVGDVSKEDAEKMQKIYSPVPGGVGSVTTSVLLNHLAQAATMQAPKH